jgi:hemerythrin superfamily protein
MPKQSNWQSATPRNKNGNGADVVALLKQDHAEVKKLFQQFEKAEDDDDKEQIARKICLMLTVHATCEEELVYPAAREVLDDEELIPEAEVEHETAKSLIAQIEEGTPGDERFDALVKVLGEYINHHVAEEEGEVLPKLKRKGIDVRDLGAAVQARKAELMAEMGETEAASEEREEPEEPSRRRSRSRSQDDRNEQHRRSARRASR